VLVVLVGPHQELSFPDGLQRQPGPIAPLAAEPPRAGGRRLAQSPRARKPVLQRPGPNLIASLFQPDRLGAVELDAAVLQVVFQALPAGLDLLARGAHDHGVAAGLDPPHLEIGQTRRRLGGRVGEVAGRDRRLLAAPGKLDRQDLAVDLVAGPLRVDPHHVHLVLERGHLLAQIKPKRPPAPDVDGQVRVLCRRASGARRLGLAGAR